LVRGINSFTLALRKVRPDAEVKVVWVNSWYDPGKEGDAAKALIDQGADIILQHTDSPAPLQIAEARGVFAVGQASDMARFAPKAQLTAIVDNWDGYYIKRTQQVLDGDWEAGDTWGGLATGMVEMSPFNEAIPADVQEEARTVEAQIRSGELHPFTGPIMDQEGELRVKGGEVLSDDVLLSMDWYVEGVQGKLPK
jgi:simple sugar transport system substrate-binding protein